MICVSILDMDARTMAARARRAFREGAEAVEFRVDALPCPQESDLEILSSVRGTKVLTLKGNALSLLSSPLVKRFDFLDIEYEDYIEKREEIPEGIRLILSTHRAFNAREAYSYIARILHENAIAKCINTIDGYKSSFVTLRASKVFKKRGNIIAFGMGEKGTLSRIVSMLSDAPISYACQEGMSVAPGQLTLQQMKEAREGIVLGILGSKQATDHSLSPALHSRLLSLSGLKGVYLRFPAERKELREFINAALAARVLGFNVTMPHKQAIIRYLDSLDPLARETGSVNTVLIRNGKCRGFNTDALAFSEIMERVRPESTLIFGTGGAARAAAYVLRGTQCYIEGRNEQRRRAIARRFSLIEDKPVPSRYDILVNCTPLGMNGDAELPEAVRNSEYRLVVDFVYGGSGLFRRLSHAKRAGFIDGSELLYRQALHSFYIWTGKRPVVSRSVVEEIYA